MRTAYTTASVPSDRYWRDCWLDTERQLANSTDKDLRAVYAELIAHYQRMAVRYDARPGEGAMVTYGDASTASAETAFPQ